MDNSIVVLYSFIENINHIIMELGLKEVDFGGKKVWPDGPSSVVVSKKTATLTPTNMQEDLTVTITINDKLANYYFGERPWDPIDRWIFKKTYKSRFAGYSYLVEAKFSSGITVGSVFTVAEQSEFEKAVEAGEFELEFHDVLPQSGLLETGWELEDLAGVKVPVQVNFTVYANGRSYVKTSQGILDLAYTTTQYVEIKVEWNSVIQHIVADTVAGAVMGAGTGALVGSIIPGAGTMTGAAAGGVIGGTLGFIYGVVWHGILGRP